MTAPRKRTNASARAAGRTWENEVAKTLREAGWPRAERRRLTGVKDRGDISGILNLVVECKNAQAMKLSEWLGEAQVEAANDGPESLGVVWIKRRGYSSALEGYVMMDGSTFVELLKKSGME